jgi:hypothetical protein
MGRRIAILVIAASLTAACLFVLCTCTGADLFTAVQKAAEEALSSPGLANFPDIVKYCDDDDFTLTNPDSLSIGQFTFTCSDTEVATLSGNVVHIVGPGIATITATQAAAGHYESASIDANLTVTLANPHLDNFVLTVKNYEDSDFQLPQPSSSSSGAFSYSSENLAVATITGNIVHIVGAGTSLITATQEAWGDYGSGSINASLTVNPIPPELSNFDDKSMTYGDDPFFLTPPTSNSPGAFSYSSSNGAVATVSGTTVTIVGAGDSTITATQAATTNYTSGEIDATLTVIGIPPTVTTTTISGIRTTRASGGGNVISAGGLMVTARGVCWNTTGTPTVSDDRTFDGTGTGSFSSNLTGLDAQTTYYVRAYATNSKGTEYGSQKQFHTVYTVGDSYKGGVIFFVVDDSPNDYALIVAPYFLENAYWSNTWGIVDATSTTDGAANTKAIVDNQGDGSYAARLCYDYDDGTYHDWYLPAFDHLVSLLDLADMFAWPHDYYWSSTEYDSMRALATAIGGGYAPADKTMTKRYVLAIRREPPLPPP